MAFFHSQQHNHSFTRLSWRGRWFLVLVLVPLALLSSCGSSPHYVTDNVFSGVAAVSPMDVWAVGYMTSQPGKFSDKRVLIEHWDGGQWRTVPSSVDGTLTAIAAVAANDVWAVGSLSGSISLTMHWDGAHWSQVPSPNPSNAALSAVVAVSSHDVWAVGYQGISSLILHWDGQQWRTVSLASPPDGSVGPLSSVRAISPTDVWVLGQYARGVRRGLVEHWDGQDWQIVPTADSPQDQHLLFDDAFSDLTVLSKSNIWVIGQTEIDQGTPKTLVEHWDGTSWQVVDTPMPSSPPYSYPQHIFAVNAQDLWITGYWYSPKTYTDYPSLLHWDGQSWQIATPPSFQTASGIFSAGTADATGDLWVVGSSGGVFFPAPNFATSVVSHTLVEHWDGTRWSRVPSPNPGQPVDIPRG